MLMRRFLLVMVCLLLLVHPAHAAPADAQCFPDQATVPQCLGAPFAGYWQSQGGLAVFGYPLAPAQHELNPDLQRTFLTQWTERARLEAHPEHAGTPYAMLLGRLGADGLARRGRQPDPAEPGPSAGCRWFAETGHNVCDQDGAEGFKRYWEGHGLALPGLDRTAGSLQLFGLPLTAPQLEQTSTGEAVLTQWFERARFEWHPANPAGSRVLLGLLGRELLANPIVLENRQGGSGDWQLRRPGFQVANDVTGEIKGYASATSVAGGEALTFAVTVNPPQSYVISLYRIGWYGGAGGRLISEIGPLEGTTQPFCAAEPASGLIACGWPAAHTLTIPGDWTSGIYLALLTNSAGYQNYIPFVVRDDTRAAALLYQQSVTTDQAYNNYPTTAGGKSLYSFNSTGPPTITGETRATHVSFDRPYSGDGDGQFLQWEIYFVQWMERMGYDVSYSTDLDTHAHGDRLRRSRAFLAVGHDEYWSGAMYDAVEQARDQGVHLGFFGANMAYWQVRFAPSASGAPNRVMICYKNAELDPEPAAPAKTIRFRDLGRAEQGLVGVQYTGYSPTNSYTDFRVASDGHWVYANTGLRAGDSVRGIVGYEVDSLVPGVAQPAAASRAILGRSPFVADGGRRLEAHTSIYQAPSGSWVFASATIGWSWALNREGWADRRLQQATANILNRFVGDAGPATGGE